VDGEQDGGHGALLGRVPLLCPVGILYTTTLLETRRVLPSEARRLEWVKTTKTTKGTKPFPIGVEVHVPHGAGRHGDPLHPTVSDGSPQLRALSFVLFVAFVVLPLR